MKNKARTYLSNTKVDSFLFAILYVMVLTITAFHHHPTDLLGVKNSVTETSNERSSHAYTAEQCPIINFSRTGFNTLSAESTVESESFSGIVDYKSILRNFHYQSFISNFSCRGPPSYKVV